MTCRGILFLFDGAIARKTRDLLLNQKFIFLVGEKKTNPHDFPNIGVIDDYDKLRAAGLILAKKIISNGLAYVELSDDGGTIVYYFYNTIEYEEFNKKLSNIK